MIQRKLNEKVELKLQETQLTTQLSPAMTRATTRNGGHRNERYGTFTESVHRLVREEDKNIKNYYGVDG